MFKSKYKKILGEINQVLDTVDQSEIDSLLAAVVSANRIVMFGAGRVGMAARGFAMRLGHMGFNAYTLGDSTVPSIGVGDLIIIVSGSGETQTVVDIANLAKQNGSTVFAITGNSNSRIGKTANSILNLRAPSKTKIQNGWKSEQPMTTLNEQCLTIMFDSVVLQLMEAKGFTHETMWANHSNLE